MLGNLLKGLSKISGWFAFSRVLQISAGVAVTRILDDSDFNIIAIMVAIQGFATRFTAFNMGAHLVRIEELKESHLHVCWSYEMLRGVALMLLVCTLAPFIAGWLDDPRLLPVILISSIVFLFSAGQNPKLVKLRREGKFGTLGMIDSMPVIIYGIIAVSLACWLKTYWALVYASIFSSVTQVTIGYLVLPFSPKLNLAWEEAKPMISMGVVLLVNSICMALREHGMVFFLVVVGLGSELGYYNRAVAFSWALGMQGVAIFWRVAYPVFSAELRKKTPVLKLVNRMTFIILLVGIPVVVIAVWHAGWIIETVLTARWLPISNLWQWLVVASLFRFAIAPYEAFLQANRQEKVTMWIYVAVTLIQLIVLVIGAGKYGLAGAGISFLIGQIIGGIAFYILANRKTAEGISSPSNLITS